MKRIEIHLTNEETKVLDKIASADGRSRKNLCETEIRKLIERWQEKCKCEKPILQPQTKQCGKCKLYIDRARHILLTNPNVVKSLPQDTDGCSKDRNKCSCKNWGGCPADFPF